MLVHLVSSEQHVLEVVGTDREHDGKSNRGPERVSSTDPVPELEHVGGIDSESGDGGSIGRESDKVLRNVLLLSQYQGTRQYRSTTSCDGAQTKD